MATPDDLTADDLRAKFDAPTPFTVGLEEEVMVLHPETLDLEPAAGELLERVAGDERFKAELPAAQVELVTPPFAALGDALEVLRGARRDLVERAAPDWRLAAAGVHPFAAAEGPLSPSDRYARTRERYGPVARRQLVFALQVHVAVGGAERTLAVYNALRSHLPELAALAANARWHEGRDSQFASVRPKISEGLPRQGVPPRLASWEELSAAFEWGAASETFDPGSWWWELRPHPLHGTLELRVPDAQTTLGEAAGVAALGHALVVHLARLHDEGRQLEAAPRWRIEENRWSAARFGLDATLADLGTGEPRPARERLEELVEKVTPAASAVGGEALLAHTRALIESNGAVRQRAIGEDGGARAVMDSLTEGFLAEPGGNPL